MVLLLLNEHGNSSFLFPDLSSYNTNNQQAKYDKHLSAGSVSVEWPFKSTLVVELQELNGLNLLKRFSLAQKDSPTICVGFQLVWHLFKMLKSNKGSFALVEA